MKYWFVSGLMLLSLASFAQSKLKRGSVKPDTTIYTSAEELPEFPGGLAKFGAYIGKMKVPALDTTENLPVRGIIQTIVEKDGSLTHLKILRSSGSKTMDWAYLERFRQSPKWNPGYINGKPVRVRYSIPITMCFASDK
jgi:protein TonB